MSKGFDRSRRNDAETCLRKRFLGYEWRGTGVQRIANDLNLHYGSAGHLGMEQLYLGEQPEEAVKLALAHFNEGVEKEGIVLTDEQTPLDMVAAEHRALLEAQLTAYAMVKLPRVLAEYEVIETEQEYTTALDDSLEYWSRADVLLRRKSDGLLFIKDFKFQKQALDLWRKKLRFDSLTMGQLLGPERARGEKLGGVIVEAILKGQRLEYPKGSGLRQQASPLIYAWRKSDGSEWATRYEWTCTESHWTNGKRSVLCPGGANHRLSGFYKAKVWEEFEGGIPAYLRWVHQVDPSLLEEQFVELPPILRSEWELEEWLESSLAQEHSIAKNAAWVNEKLAQGGDITSDLRRLFPKQTNHGDNCLWCSFQNICWGNEDPDDSTLYQIRVPNHVQESGVEA